jgi:hypothetical protein
MSFQHRIQHDAFDIDGSWVDPAPGAAPLDSVGHSTAKKSRVLESGDALWSTISGAVGGALGGVAMVAAAHGIAHWQHGDLDYFELTGKAAHLFPGFGATALSGGAFAALIGALVGGMLGCLSRRATRILPRLLFFMTLTPIAWILVQAFVIRPLSVWSQTMPAAPWLAGALVYGICLALTPPIVRRDTTATADI